MHQPSETTQILLGDALRREKDQEKDQEGDPATGPDDYDHRPSCPEPKLSLEGVDEQVRSSTDTSIRPRRPTVATDTDVYHVCSRFICFFQDLFILFYFWIFVFWHGYCRCNSCATKIYAISVPSLVMHFLCHQTSCNSCATAMARSVHRQVSCHAAWSALTTRRSNMTSLTP